MVHLECLLDCCFVCHGFLDIQLLWCGLSISAYLLSGWVKRESVWEFTQQFSHSNSWDNHPCAQMISFWHTGTSVPVNKASIYILRESFLSSYLHSGCKEKFAVRVTRPRFAKKCIKHYSSPLVNHVCRVNGNCACILLASVFSTPLNNKRNKRLNKQSWGRWFGTLLRPLWRQYNVA